MHFSLFEGTYLIAINLDFPFLHVYKGRRIR